MNEYECDLMDLERDTESLEKEIDNLSEMVCDMNKRLEAIMEDLEEALCDGCLEHDEDLEEE